jgi:hypothetical protein
VAASNSSEREVTRLASPATQERRKVRRSLIPMNLDPGSIQVKKPGHC